MKDKDPGGGTITGFSREDCAVEAARVVPNGGQVHLDKNKVMCHIYRKTFSTDSRYHPSDRPMTPTHRSIQSLI